MKKIIIALTQLLFAASVYAQTPVNASQVFKNTVTFDSLKYGSTTVVNVTTFLDSVKIQGKAGATGSAGKILTSRGNDGFATWQAPAAPTTADSLNISGNLTIGGTLTANGNVLIGGNFGDTITLGTGIGKPSGTPLALTPGGAIYPDTSCPGKKCVDSVYNGTNLSNGDIKLGGPLTESTKIIAASRTFNVQTTYSESVNGWDTLGALPSFKLNAIIKQRDSTRYSVFGLLNLAGLGQDSTTSWMGEISTIGTSCTNFAVSPHLSKVQGISTLLSDSNIVANMLMEPGAAGKLNSITYNTKSKRIQFGFAARDEASKTYANIFYGIYPDSSGNNIKDITRLEATSHSANGKYAVYNAAYTVYRFNGFYAGRRWAQLDYNKQDGDSAQATGQTWTLDSSGLSYFVNGVKKAGIDTVGIITSTNIRLAQSTQAYGGTVAQDTTVNLYVYTSSTGAATFNLSTTASIGTRVTIKDGIGEAVASNITIDSGGGNTIDAAQTYDIANNYGWVTLQKASATLWVIIGKD